MLAELDRVIPRVVVEFPGYAENRFGANVKVELWARYEGADVVKSVVDLGRYLDPGYGVAWEGTLAGRRVQPNEFRYVLCFTEPGSFEFRIKYQTAQGSVGVANVSVVVADE
jgi:hypothetical protein